MGKDTATFEHAKAYLHDWLRRCKDDRAENIRCWADGWLEILRATPPDAEPDAEAVGYVIDRAAVERWVWDSLQDIVSRRLHHDQPLGEALRQWAGDVVSRARTPPKTPAGAPRRTLARNYMIVRALMILRDECGLTLMRNDASGSHSACDVLVELLADYGVTRSYKTVAEVWSKQPESGYRPDEIELVNGTYHWRMNSDPERKEFLR